MADSGQTAIKLHRRLLAFHMSVGKIRKDSVNPHFKSRYSDINSVLSVVMPALTSNGIILTQSPEVTANGGMILCTRLTNADDKDDFIEGKVPMVVKDQSNPQQLGSAFSYFRRYSLVAMLDLESVDDDGQATQQYQQQRNYNG